MGGCRTIFSEPYSESIESTTYTNIAAVNFGCNVVGRTACDYYDPDIVFIRCTVSIKKRGTVRKIHITFEQGSS